MNLYCVSDWRSYVLTTAVSPIEAVQSVYGHNYALLDNKSINENSVIHVMCCEYIGYVELALEALHLDVDRVIWLDNYTDTLRFQLNS